MNPYFIDFIFFLRMPLYSRSFGGIKDIQESNLEICSFFMKRDFYAPYKKLHHFTIKPASTHNQAGKPATSKRHDQVIVPFLILLYPQIFI